MKTTAKPLPFELNRNLHIPLSTQLADGLRNAILSGYYKTGDILPSYEQLARELNVSLRIPREAMADLVAQNMVNPRPRIGCQVLPNKAKTWKGRIYVIAPGDTFVTYFAIMLFEQFRKVMTERSWLVDLLTFSRNEHGRSDFSMLNDALTRTCDFALLIFPTAATIRYLEKNNIRYICFQSDAGEREYDPTISFTLAMDEIIRRIHRKHIEKVTLIGYRRLSEVCNRLSQAGVSLDYLEVPWMTGIGYLERIAAKGYELTKKHIQSRKRPVRELVFYTDDFVSRGGLLALQESQLKIPDDISVVTFANRGNAPFFPLRLTRIEANPFDLARKIADEVLRRISGLPPQHLATSVQYQSGISF